MRHRGIIFNTTVKQSENVSYISVAMDNTPDLNNLKGMGFVYSSRGFVFIIGEE